ncbi:MAG: hypothetical protein HY940_06825 [Gammaproteobacteria bacterium]|nr:hypothetical protein [Gammaproteobacteria bacterium]
MRVLGRVIVLLTMMLGPVLPAWAAAAENVTGNDTQVLSQFNRYQVQEGEAVKIGDQQKHRILFYMGAALLMLVLATASLGVAMAIYNKPLFIGHMVAAGLTVTLAIAHAVVAVVWFFPF